MKAVCIDFICPHCNGLYEVYMRKTPRLMVLDCPHCKNSLIIYDGNILEYNETIASKIRNIKNDIDAELVLNDIDEKVRKKNKNIISKDDVVNFSIGLHSCKSFDEVLELICKN